MKFKRALALILSAGLSVTALTGCSDTTKNYTKELSKISEWTASSGEINGDINVDVNGQKINFKFDGTTYTSNNKSEYDIKFTDPSGVVNIPEIKGYSDGSTSYINKSYFEGIYKMSGEKMPQKLADIKDEYIGIETGMDVGQIQKLATDPEALMKLGNAVFGDSDVDVPFVQNGREYSINLDSNQMIDLFLKSLKAGSNNLSNINTTFGIGMSTEEIAKTQTEVNAISSNLGEIQKIKDQFKGMSLSTKDVFSDDTYVQNIKLNVPFKNIKNNKVSTVNISIDVNSKCSKAEQKEIVMPTNSVKLTYQQYIDLCSIK